MPIDPSILQGLKPLQIEDPLSLYTNYLAARGGQNQLAKYEQEDADRNALNAAMKEYATGGYDAVIRRLGATSGHQVPGVLTLKTAAEKARLEKLKVEDDLLTSGVNRQKSQSELLNQGLERVRNYFGTLDHRDPNAAARYRAGIKGMLTDEVMGPFFAGEGRSLESFENELQTALQGGPDGLRDLFDRASLTAEKLKENHFVNRDMGGTIDTQRMPKYGAGPAVTVPGSTAKVTPNPNAPKTVVSMSNQLPKDLSKSLAPEVAERIDKARDAALKAPEQAKAVDNVFDLLDKPTITGAGSGLRLGIAKVLNLVTGNTDQDLIMNTEELNSELARATLQLFQAFGVGARGIDTPAERKYLERIAGASDLSVDSLRRLAQRLRSDAQNSVVRYNTEIRGLAPDVLGYYNHKPLPMIPDRKPPKAPPVARPAWKPGDPPPADAIEYLKKNPGTRATFEKTYGELGKRAAKDALDAGHKVPK